MGCDIHYVIEKNYDGRWVAVYAKSETPEARPRSDEAKSYDFMAEINRRPVFSSRFYPFFAQLAGVRGEGPDPVGVPKDASELSHILIKQWEGDGHSHSWLPYRDFCQRYTVANGKMFTNNGDLRDLAGVEEDEFDAYRVVFWFDC